MLRTRLLRLDSKHRRRQIEIQRAVAEAELDLCTATANAVDTGLTEASARGATKAECVVVEAGERIGSHFSDIGVVEVGDFGEATETVSPDEGREDRRVTSLEPGEVPV